MEKFVQELLNTMMFKKLTTAFPVLRKKKLNGRDLEENWKTMVRSGLAEALKESNQDPEKIAEMALIAFDQSVKEARSRLQSFLGVMVKFAIKEQQIGSSGSSH